MVVVGESTPCAISPLKTCRTEHRFSFELPKLRFRMIKTLLLDEWRFLTFRPMSPAIRTHWQAYLAFGLLFTWLAGVGRYWDNPRAGLWQQLD